MNTIANKTTVLNANEVTSDLIMYMNLCGIVDIVHWSTTLLCLLLHQVAHLDDNWNVVVVAKLRNRSIRSEEVALVSDVRNVVVTAYALPPRHRPNRSEVVLIDYVRNVVSEVSTTTTTTGAATRCRCSSERSGIALLSDVRNSVLALDAA